MAGALGDPRNQILLNQLGDIPSIPKTLDAFSSSVGIKHKPRKPAGRFTRYAPAGAYVPDPVTDRRDRNVTDINDAVEMAAEYPTLFGSQHMVDMRDIPDAPDEGEDDFMSLSTQRAGPFPDAMSTSTQRSAAPAYSDHEIPPMYAQAMETDEARIRMRIYERRILVCRSIVYTRISDAQPGEKIYFITMALLRPKATSVIRRGNGGSSVKKFFTKFGTSIKKAISNLSPQQKQALKNLAMTGAASAYMGAEMGLTPEQKRGMRDSAIQQLGTFLLPADRQLPPGALSSDPSDLDNYFNSRLGNSRFSRAAKEIIHSNPDLQRASRLGSSVLQQADTFFKSGQLTPELADRLRSAMQGHLNARLDKVPWFQTASQPLFNAGNVATTRPIAAICFLAGKMASHYKMHDSVGEVVPWNAKYSYPTQASRSWKSEVKVPPKNGGTFTSGSSNLIRFELPAQGYLNTRHSGFIFDVTLNKSLANSRLQNGAASIIKRARLLYGSLVLEDIREYSQIVRMLSEGATNNVTGMSDQASVIEGVGGLTLVSEADDPEDPTNRRQRFYNSRVIDIQTGGPTPDLAAKGIVSSANPRRYQVQFLFGLFQQNKLLPLKWMASQLAIEIELAPYAEACCDEGGLDDTANRSYTVHNLNLLLELLEFDGSYDQAFLEGLRGDGVPIKFASWNTHINTPTGADRVTINIPERSRSIKALFNVLVPRPQASTALKMAFDSQAMLTSCHTSDNLPDGSGVYIGWPTEFQWRIGGKYHPAQAVQCASMTDAGNDNGWRSARSNGGAEAYFEFAKALNIVSDYRLSTPINSNRWLRGDGVSLALDWQGANAVTLGSDVGVRWGDDGPSAFVIAASTETSDGSEISGLNGEEQNDISLMITYSHPQDGKAAWYTFTYYDALLVLRSNDAPSFNLENAISNVLGIKIVNAHIPYTFYTVHSGNNALRFRLGSEPETVRRVSIPSGNYDADELGLLLTDLLTEASDGNATFTVTYQRPLLKYTVTADTSFSLLFEDTSASSHVLFGFLKNTNFDSVEESDTVHRVTAPNAAMVTGPNCLLLTSSLGGRISRTLHLNGTTSQDPPIIAKIPITCHPGELIEYLDPSAPHAFDTSNLQIQQLEFQLLYPDTLEVVHMNGAPWSLTLGALVERDASISRYTEMHNNRAVPNKHRLYLPGSGSKRLRVGI
ncbi:hypothetical protein BC832DRAFT_608452 [Gaertneriomyces semiglobifer]|nr:hypothetical protein BC832DRAFT_608452 [Gaertneriomyces semiglobifer]